MVFKEPKVEVIRIEMNQVVYASGGCQTDYAGGVMACEGSIPSGGCNDAKMIDLNTPS